MFTICFPRAPIHDMFHDMFVYETRLKHDMFHDVFVH